MYDQAYSIAVNPNILCYCPCTVIRITVIRIAVIRITVIRIAVRYVSRYDTPPSSKHSHEDSQVLEGQSGEGAGLYIHHVVVAEVECFQSEVRP